MEDNLEYPANDGEVQISERKEEDEEGEGETTTGEDLVEQQLRVNNYSAAEYWNDRLNTYWCYHNWERPQFLADTSVPQSLSIGMLVMRA